MGEHTVDSSNAIGFRKTGAGGNGGYEVILVHGSPPKLPGIGLKEVSEYPDVGKPKT